MTTIGPAVSLIPQEQVVTHIHLNTRYRVKFERPGSTKGIDGFTVEANGDSLEAVQDEAAKLYQWAKGMTMPLEAKQHDAGKGEA
mgnify:FL=1